MNPRAVRGALVAVVGTTLGCSQPRTIASCDADLRGTWHDEAGARWMILDARTSLEVYPLFDDGRPADTAPDVVAAPRVLDLHRGPDGLRGEAKRRFMRGGDACIARAPVVVTRCAGATLELVMADPAPPTRYAPCERAVRNAPSRRERWRR